VLWQGNNVENDGNGNWIRTYTQGCFKDNLIQSTLIQKVKRVAKLSKVG
jgi:hypothetical protein